MMGGIRQVFDALPPIVQLGFVLLIGATLQALLLHALSAVGLKQAKELLASLDRPREPMTDEAKGELYAWINVCIWVALFFDAAHRGSMDRLIGGFVIWIAVTTCVLLAWAITQKRAQP